MSRPIPERAPIGEALHGVVIAVDDAALLALTAPDGADVRVSGHFVVRYGVRYLGKPHLSIVPGLLALDYGDILTGVEAWEFLHKRSHLYPRAEVFGYRNDGMDDMQVVKLLDLALAPATLVYADADATRPLAQLDALIAPPDADLPPYLQAYLPRYPTVAAWQAEVNRE